MTDQEADDAAQELICHADATRPNGTVQYSFRPAFFSGIDFARSGIVVATTNPWLVGAIEAAIEEANRLALTAK